MPNVVSVCRWLPTPVSESGGVFVLRRLRAMADCGDVAVVQPVPYFPVLKRLPRWAREGGHKSSNLSISHQPMFYLPKVLKSLDGYWLYRALYGPLRRMHSSRTIDIIDAHFGYPDGVGSYLVAKRLGIPFFVTFRGLEADYEADPLIAPQIRKALKGATGCICVSTSLRDLALRYGADPEKLRVIHNGVDKSMFKPGERNDARRSLGLPPDDPMIVSVGNLVSVKGHEVLIRALRSLLGRWPTVRLAIVGGAGHEPDHPAALRALATELEVDRAVHFVGSVPPSAVAAWLRAANVFALATRREGCCNAVLEALSSGIPVVTTPAGDNALFVKDGESGFIVAVDDSNALAGALDRALAVERWDAGAISKTLTVNDWAEVGRQVVAFFGERTRDAAPSSAVAPRSVS